MHAYYQCYFVYFQAIAIMLIFALRSCIKFQDETKYISKKTFL